MSLSVLAFVLLLSLVAISGFSDAQTPVKEVIIKNDLGSGLVLGLHCASADDDLGFKLLPPNEEWIFKFHTRFLGNTLCHCSFVRAGAEKRAFAVYSDNQHRYACTQCYWSIQSNGTCLSNGSISQVGCYPWVPAWTDNGSSDNGAGTSTMN